ncbi:MULTISPECIES: tetratricopeptide repeat protein [unclassified Parabacteroides]|uniref:tetratricopeptide repeat protein n=1 Tax=unclassified Parabacteroides TaxID=2649774 RepID=UPI002476C2B1|nr:MULTISPECIES: tetratricopeptide repeat protein [unclassified Parabacteroides]
MKSGIQQFILLCMLLVVAPGIYGQEKADSLILQGIRFHDAHKYRKAIEAYKQALEIEPDSPTALYELSLSLLETKDYPSVIQYSDRLIALNNEHSPLAYNLKGSSLNYLKRTEEAIEVYIEGINKYDNIALLHFNLAIAYFTQKDFEKARDTFVEAIFLDPQYAGSHLNLARTMVNLDRWPEALLCFYYFLLLENDTQRGIIAYESILEQLDITTANMDLFRLKTEEFLEKARGLKELKIMSGFWSDFYIPFFETAYEKGLLEDLCYYISLYFNKDANNWGKKNEARLDHFTSWLENWQ